MAYMKLGTYTFPRNPSYDSPPDLLTPEKYSASVQTYSSIAYFSWGLGVAGKELSLDWGYLPDSQYQAFQTILEADVPVVFDPKDGTMKTYLVEVTGLKGRVHAKLGEGSTGVWRKDVSLSLLVLGVVA